MQVQSPVYGAEGGGAVPEAAKRVFAKVTIVGTAGRGDVTRYVAYERFGEPESSKILIVS